MLISELIAKLQAAQADRGDCNVRVMTGGYIEAVEVKQEADPRQVDGYGTRDFVNIKLWRG